MRNTVPGVVFPADQGTVDATVPIAGGGTTSFQLKTARLTPGASAKSSFLVDLQKNAGRAAGSAAGAYSEYGRQNYAKKDFDECRV